MINIVLIICISLVIMVVSICATMIIIRKGNYKDIVLNDSDFQAAIAECNKLSGQIKLLKDTSNNALVSIISNNVDKDLKIEFAKYVLNQIKNL